MLRKIHLAAFGILFLAVAAVAQDEVMGNWEGTFTSKDWNGKPISAQIIDEGKGEYRAFLEIGQDKKVMVTGEAGKKGAQFSGKAYLDAEIGGACNIECKVADGKLTGRFSGRKSPGPFEMARVVKKSPSLGAKPPDGAVVLFDGTNVDAWNFKKTPWELVEGGAMEIRPGDTFSKQEFGDCKIHLEFRTPFMPRARGQGRGNSGVYIQGMYEVQVLDSFGLAPADNGCGGIYKKAVPKVNACLPPMEWQTYDIAWRAPRFNEAGQKTENARITLEHNGVLIHDDVELDGRCGGGLPGEEGKTGSLLLQDHSNRVQFRNIWILPQ